MSKCRVCDGTTAQRLHKCPDSRYYIPGSDPAAEAVLKMPSVWSKELGLPDVGPIRKDYPITEAEFRARQVNYGNPPPHAEVLAW